MIRLAALIFLLIFTSTVGYAQSDKKVRTYNISKKTETITKFKDGKEDTTYVSQYEIFNEEGEWIEKVDLQKDGDIKRREVRKYDGDRIVEEIKDEPQEKEWTEKTPDYDHVVYTFENGELIREEELNREGEIKETKVYSYNKYGDKIEERKLDKDGELDQKEVYSYDNRGLRSEKKTYDKDGELVEVKKYTYE